ncbi:MAG: ankyrin repeat domain-containing protein [Alphaproteobacteria bacterium]
MVLAALVIAMSAPASAQNRDQALIAAAGEGDLAAAERLIREGASVAACDGRGRTALLAATHANHVAVARALIAAGADVNAKDNMGDSAFLYAGAEGRIEILKMALPTAELKSTNRYGGTALIPAAHHGHVEAVRILLGTAIDKDHVNKLGWTALLEAVILGDGGPVHTEIVRLLVEAGANVNIVDRDGVTPLAHARRHGYGAIVRILEARAAR